MVTAEDLARPEHLQASGPQVPRATTPILLLVVALGVCGAGRAAHGKPSCGQGGATGQASLSAGGGQAKLSVPTSYSATQAMPLLLALHGDEGTPDYIYSVFLGQQKATPTFILVAPKAPYGGGSWYQATTQHVTFVNAVITDVLAKYNIDKDRVWITGWSGGATFLGYYAVARQDVFAAVVYHMGGGGGGGYAPPAASCKIPARFVIGSQDFLYSLAKQQHDTLQAKGHEVVWIETPGVGHEFQPATLAPTWSWLQQQTLCGTTTPGSCGGLQPDSGAPPPKADAKPPAKLDGGAVPHIDRGAASPSDGGSSGAELLAVRHDGGGPAAQRNIPDGCTVGSGASPGGGGEQLGGGLLLLALALCRRRSAGSHR